MIKLKNYTTGISADKSVMEIERFLSMFGANAIMKEFLSDGKIRTLSFKMDGKGYKIPANVEGVEKIVYKRGAKTQLQHEQAYKITWRIIRDWIHAQLSLIASGQAQPDEVLLPYLWDGKRTLYDAFKEGRIQIGHDAERG